MTATGPSHYVGQRIPYILCRVARRLRVPRVRVSVCPICTVHIPICGDAPVDAVDILHVSHPAIDIINYIPIVHPIVHTWQIHVIHVCVSFYAIEISVGKSTGHVTHAPIHIHCVSAISSCVQWRVPDGGTVATQGHSRLLGAAGGNKGEA